jgi:hypothetical protein
MVAACSIADLPRAFSPVMTVTGVRFWLPFQPLKFTALTLVKYMVVFPFVRFVGCTDCV